MNMNFSKAFRIFSATVFPSNIKQEDKINLAGTWPSLVDNTWGIAGLENYSDFNLERLVQLIEWDALPFVTISQNRQLDIIKSCAM
jgi:hypothetical protein